MLAVEMWLQSGATTRASSREEYPPTTLQVQVDSGTRPEDAV